MKIAKLPTLFIFLLMALASINLTVHGTRNESLEIAKVREKLSLLHNNNGSAKVKEFLEGLDTEKYLSLKLEYASQYIDYELYFKIFDECFEKGYRLDGLRYSRGIVALADFLVTGLSGENKYLGDPAEVEKILQNFEDNYPDWKIESKRWVEYVGTFRETSLGYLYARMASRLSTDGVRQFLDLKFHKDFELAEKYYLRAIELKSSSASSGYPYFLLKCKKDIPQLIEYIAHYTKEEYNDNLLLLLYGELPNYSESIIKLYENAANDDLPMGLLLLSFIYEDGIYVEKNLNKAREYQKKVLDEDTDETAEILTNLGNSLNYQFKNPANANKILFLLKTASDMGSSNATISLVRIYAQDPTKPYLDISEASIDFPLMEILKKDFLENRNKNPKEVSKYPKEISDKIFDLIRNLNRKEMYHGFVHDDIYYAYLFGLDRFEKNIEKADILKNRLSNQRPPDEMVVWQYMNDGNILKKDHLKAVDFIETKEKLSEYDISSLEQIKENLKDNLELQKRIDEILKKEREPKRAPKPWERK